MYIKIISKKINMNSESFFSLLNDTSVTDLPNIEEKPHCYITGEDLDDLSVTLNCRHTFNYHPLYQEIIKQKHSIRNKMNYLTKWNIECPYCRVVQNKLIPYKKMSGVRRIRGVNSPKEWCMKNNKCLVCNEPCDSKFCNKAHDNLYNKCQCMVKSSKKKNTEPRRCHNRGIYVVKDAGEEIRICGVHNNQYKVGGITKLNLFKKKE